VEKRRFQDHRPSLEDVDRQEGMLLVCIVRLLRFSWNKSYPDTFPSIFGESSLLESLRARELAIIDLNN